MAKIMFDEFICPVCGHVVKMENDIHVSQEQIWLFQCEHCNFRRIIKLEERSH